MDLFAGAGGMSLGFDNAGFKNLLAVEFILQKLIRKIFLDII